MTRASLHFTHGTDRRRTWGRPDEEYIADFLLIAKRTLTPDEHKVFRYHYLLGADWRLCTRQLKIDRGAFFHAIYRIERKLGRVFHELEPYSLYPVDEYFATKVNPIEPTRMPGRPPNGQPIHPPLQQAA